MRDFNDLIVLIKKAAKEAVTASKPAEIRYGIVTSIKPIEVLIDQKLNLNDDLIVKTEIIKSLKKGDKIALLRNQGGQEYLILDKVVEK